MQFEKLKVLNRSDKKEEAHFLVFRLFLSPARFTIPISSTATLFDSVDFYFCLNTFLSNCTIYLNQLGTSHHLTKHIVKAD